MKRLLFVLARSRQQIVEDVVVPAGQRSKGKHIQYSALAVLLRNSTSSLKMFYFIYFISFFTFLFYV